MLIKITLQKNVILIVIIFIFTFKKYTIEFISAGNSIYFLYTVLLQSK